MVGLVGSRRPERSVKAKFLKFHKLTKVLLAVNWTLIVVGLTEEWHDANLFVQNCDKLELNLL